ncbi:MAG: T9SS type A sorting domain-containing protein, partial [Bacteroidota bacterium]
QIAFLDSTGKVEKIIDDPKNFLPSNIIAYKDGWIRNYTTSLIHYDANYKVVSKFITNFESQNCYFESSHLSLVENGRALLLAGYSRACNPYDFNHESRYNRPTAFVVDSNFTDYGKAKPPYEAPKPFAVIKAFPNPALESITLQVTETAAEYAFYNSMGMFVSSGSMASSADISLLNMASGMYIIQLKTPQGNYIGNVKFLKK